MKAYPQSGQIRFPGEFIFSHQAVWTLDSSVIADSVLRFNPQLDFHQTVNAQRIDGGER